MRISIGVHVQEDADGVRATLAHLRHNTSQPVDILLLADGPDAATRRLLDGLDDLPQSATEQPMGAPACFNRLLRASPAADVLIFLEAGALVGPDWLAPLIAALQADSRNGLAGPSTNRAWNVQATFPSTNENGVARTAMAAKARFGATWQTLDPLHSLADFCYAARRDVVAAVGAADEGYGRGPCWEIDYTTRAARAGYRAVWAQGSFVYRRSFAARRRNDEERLMEASKHRYQDKFCGQRLSGAWTGFAAHCRGETCPHFAPSGLVRTHLPLEQGAAATAAVPDALPAPPASVATLPLVSCIMPTRDRRDWMLQAIRYFQRQDYPERELIIVDDGGRSGDDIPCDPRIRYVRSRRRLSIGAKRNHACEIARGSIIAHWDDDDWYAPHRLSVQVAPLLAGKADITALSDTRMFDLTRWEYWACSPDLHRRLFVLDVHGGTLVFNRRVYQELGRYPDSSLAEDAVFLRTAVGRGARLRSVPAGDSFLYLRHGTNAWAFTCGQHLDPSGWQRIEEPAALAGDRAFYAARSPRADQPRVSVTVVQHAPPPAPARMQPDASDTGLPLVSCIMPTHNRRPFVPKAIEYFLRQDYPRRELVILDDGDDRVADLIPEHPSIRYASLPRRMRLGPKRNAAIEAASGDLILHWDDDDWMDAGRISHQVQTLLAGDGDICGASSIYFCEVESGRISIYRYPPSKRRWLYGATLCYRRSLWQQKPFEALDIGEDTRFVWRSPVGRMIDLGQFRGMVAMVHTANTSRPRPLSGANWVAWKHADGEAMLGSDWAFYAGMRRASAA